MSSLANHRWRALLAIVVIALGAAAMVMLARPQPSTESEGTETLVVGTLFEQLDRDPDLTTFLKALEVSGLDEKIANQGPYTVFAPTNDAFKQLPAGKLDELFKPENRRALTHLVRNHIVPGSLPSSKLAADEVLDVRSAHGSMLRVASEKGTLAVMDATVTKPDVIADNGVLHVIDRVLLPG